MNQNNAINIVNVAANVRYSQSDYYNLFLRATEIDMESIKIALRTGAPIELISPSLETLVEEKMDQLPEQ